MYYGTRVPDTRIFGEYEVLAFTPWRVRYTWYAIIVACTLYLVGTRMTTVAPLAGAPIGTHVGARAVEEHHESAAYKPSEQRRCISAAHTCIHAGWTQSLLQWGPAVSFHCNYSTQRYGTTRLLRFPTLLPVTLESRPYIRLTGILAYSRCMYVRTERLCRYTCISTEQILCLFFSSCVFCFFLVFFAASPVALEINLNVLRTAKTPFYKF